MYVSLQEIQVLVVFSKNVRDQSFIEINIGITLKVRKFEVCGKS
jgi:hypothetical protein